MIHPRARLAVLATLFTALVLTGCAADRVTPGEFTVRDAIERYGARNSEKASDDAQPGSHSGSYVAATAERPAILAEQCATNLHNNGFALDYYTLGMAPQNAPESQPAESGRAAARADREKPSDAALLAGVPDGYWRKNIWHQMGHEAKEFGGREFWRGFKTSFWDLDNALLLTATMGASVAIRETGVDDTVRRRTHGHRQLGDFDEPIQLLGNPATHFAGAGVLWLTSALTKDAKEHELARSLTQALAVNGATTLVLKAATNTRTPDNERFGWPSGHTSSAFTVAAVLNEHYGPWVGVPSLALAGLVGYQRLDSRVHDFSDVVFGAMLGYVVGTSIARDEEARFPEIFGMTVVPFNDPETGASGIALMKSW